MSDQRLSFGYKRRIPWRLAALFIVLALVAAALIAIVTGAAGIPIHRVLAALGLAPPNQEWLARDQLVLWSIRLPRITMALIVGALLAGAGAIMQGLFRNPLADPAIVGVSSGGAFTAALAIVFGDRYLHATAPALSFAYVPVAALLGALFTTAALYRISTRQGQTSVAVFLLGGIAFAALANAGIGLLVFVADDRQLRDITFWLLGSLSGATWQKVGFLLPFLLATAFGVVWIARGLDLLAMGETEAFHMGVPVQVLKRLAILFVSSAVGAAVAFCGVVGFVGIVVPHLLRLAVGPGHRALLPMSMALGAAILLIADSAARTVAAPAELPLGIITAIVGAPFFLGLLLQQRNVVTL